MLRLAYSPDLAPLDYYVFWSISYFLHSQRFNNKEVGKALVKKIFAPKDKIWYQREIKELTERWLQTMQYYGPTLNVEIKVTE